MSERTIWLAMVLILVFPVQPCKALETPESTDTNGEVLAAEKTIELRARCSGLLDQNIQGLAIASVETVTDREGLPDFCAIRGTIDPDIGFEARFPLTTWNGKFYQSGCGGYCGQVLADKKGFSNSINEALKKGYAAITSNAGHTAWIGDASWAKDNPVAVEVYAHKGIPLVYEAGLGMVEAFYGEAARLEYFGGCSNGGRLAAMAAQRYPDLFDGILGGAAVLNLSKSGGVFGSWVVQANTGDDGGRILNRRNFAYKLPALEQAVIAQCDHTDGDRDGIISQPRNCEVDVSELPLCAERDGADCFREQELAVLAKWYQGPRDSSGNQLFPGMPAGSERYWLVWFLDPEGKTAPGNGLGGDYAKFLGFEEGTAHDYTALDFNFDADPARLEANGRLLNATAPDLRAFREAGGKYLLWHGWQDPLVLPDQTVEWYESILNEMGGPSEVDPFLRLFMIPGKGHCWELPSAAPDRFDPIAVLENWVERGEAPGQLNVVALDPDSAVAPAVVVCPYPGRPVLMKDAVIAEGDYCGAQ